MNDSDEDTYIPADNSGWGTPATTLETQMAWLSIGSSDTWTYHEPEKLYCGCDLWFKAQPGDVLVPLLHLEPCFHCKMSFNRLQKEGPAPPAAL